MNHVIIDRINETRKLMKEAGVDVYIVCTKENAMKYLGKSMTVNANEELLNALKKEFGDKNVALVEGSLSKE